VALRTRLEQRFIENVDQTAWRIRQFIRAHHNLPALPRLTLVGWDEIFVNFNDTNLGPQSGFDQNRAFVGIGVKPRPTSRWRTEIGYLNQTVRVESAGSRVNHILSVNFFRSP